MTNRLIFSYDVRQCVYISLLSCKSRLDMIVQSISVVKLTPVSKNVVIFQEFSTVPISLCISKTSYFTAIRIKLRSVGNKLKMTRASKAALKQFLVIWIYCLGLAQKIARKWCNWFVSTLSYSYKFSNPLNLSHYSSWKIPTHIRIFPNCHACMLCSWLKTQSLL